jgi:excisionase family DNA binding protein
MTEHEIDLQGLDVYESQQFFENQIYTVEDIASLLKFSTKKIYNLVRNHQIPHKKIGREIRFLPSEIRGWLKGR